MNHPLQHKAAAVVDQSNEGKVRVLSLVNLLLSSLRDRKFQDYIGEYAIFTTNLFLNHMTVVAETLDVLKEAVPEDTSYVYSQAEVIDVEAITKLQGLTRLHLLTGSLLKESLLTIEQAYKKRVYVSREYLYYLIMRNLISIIKELTNYWRTFSRLRRTPFFRNIADKGTCGIETYKCLLIRRYFVSNCLEFLNSL